MMMQLTNVLSPANLKASLTNSPKNSTATVEKMTRFNTEADSFTPSAIQERSGISGKGIMATVVATGLSLLGACTKPAEKTALTVEETITKLGLTEIKQGLAANQQRDLGTMLDCRTFRNNDSQQTTWTNLTLTGKLPTGEKVSGKVLEFPTNSFCNKAKAQIKQTLGKKPSITVEEMAVEGTMNRVTTLTTYKTEEGKAFLKVNNTLLEITDANAKSKKPLPAQIQIANGIVL